MKYALIGDLHGTDLGGLEVALRFENPDFLICTGDFDQTKTIHQYIALVDHYKRSGRGVITVMGNHDEAILNNRGIGSETLKKEGKTCFQLHDELMNDSIAKDYIESFFKPENIISLMKNPDEKKFHEKRVLTEPESYYQYKVRLHLDWDKGSREYQTSIMHGAYEGDLSAFPTCKGDFLKTIWTRLRTEEDYAKNFEMMNEKGHKIMIRGHDHHAMYVYEDPNMGIVMINPLEAFKREYSLSKHQNHVINPGALNDGFFATIDTSVPGKKEPILRYHNTSDYTHLVNDFFKRNITHTSFP